MKLDIHKAKCKLSAYLLVFAYERFHFICDLLLLKMLLYIWFGSNHGQLLSDNNPSMLSFL
jgi:hypothetical protein